MVLPILIEAFPPDGDALLSTSAKLITGDMLEEISRADYGMDADAHLAALRAIRDEARLPSPLRWEPKEVLALVRWSQPDDPNWKPGSTGQRGHIMRAFCCSALLRAAADPSNDGFFDGENQTLIQLIDSALFLNRGLPEAAGRFLTWRLPQLRSDDPERPFFAFGLVAIALLLNPRSPKPSDIDALISFVEGAEAEARDLMRVRPPNMIEDSFLAGTFFDQRHSVWRALATRLRLRMSDSERVVGLARRIEAV